MERFTIVESAHVVPERIVTNDELATFMDTSDEWIHSRTGIHQRYIVSNENTSDLATAVADKLLAQANLSADQLDFIVVGTMSPDHLTPSVPTSARSNWCNECFAFDLSAACSGFVYTLSMASSY